MGNLQKREKVILAVVGLLIIFYVYYQYFLSPIIGQISERNANINMLKDKWNTIVTMNSTNSELTKQLEGLKAKSIEVSKTLPGNPRLPEIMFNLKKLGDADKVNISNLSFGTPASALGNNQDSNQQPAADANNNQLMMLPISISVSSSDAAILKYISDIENAKRITNVDQVTISKDDKGVMQASITANYYYINSNGIEVRGYDFDKPINKKADLFK